MSVGVVVHVQPRATRTEVAGRHGDAVKIRLAAPPVDGAANEELVRFVAETLRVPRRSVHIAHGLTGRRKTVVVDGLSPDAVARALIGTTC